MNKVTYEARIHVNGTYQTTTVQAENITYARKQIEAMYGKGVVKYIEKMH